MQFTALITATLLALASAQSDPQSDPDIPLSPAETSCRTKSLGTGSGAHAAIHGFCSQIEDSALNSSLAQNGYTVGGFQPSGQTSTAKVTVNGCQGAEWTRLDEDACVEALMGVCAKGDKLGKGTGKTGCLGFEIQ